MRIRGLSPLGRDTDRDEVNHNSRAGVQGGKLPSSLARGNEANLSELVVVNPLDHSGWDDCIANERGGSLFHTTIWARVLQETYGHKPVYVCQALGGKFQQLLPIMEVSSPWTGLRGVSLPFTDICIPFSVSEHPREMYEFAMEQGRRRGWRYLECRGGNWECPGVSPAVQFWGHVVDLENSEESLFKRLAGAVRRGIRKAKRSDLQIEFSTELSAMRDFFRLHCATRRRHGIPPQPRLFFDNIARLVLAKGHGFVVIARFESRPVAASVFFHFGHEVIYKFGASNFDYQQLRANNLVMWEAIKRYAANGFAHLHLGRTSMVSEGLRRFKLGLGASEERIHYFKYDFRKESFIAGLDRTNGWLTRVFRRLPVPILRIIGGLAYPHRS